MKLVNGSMPMVTASLPFAVPRQAALAKLAPAELASPGSEMWREFKTRMSEVQCGVEVLGMGCALPRILLFLLPLQNDPTHIGIPTQTSLVTCGPAAVPLGQQDQ